MTIDVDTSDPLVPVFDVPGHERITSIEVVTCEGECPPDVLDARAPIDRLNCSGAFAPGEPDARAGSHCIEWHRQSSDVLGSSEPRVLVPVAFGTDTPLVEFDTLPVRPLPAGEHVVRATRQVGAFDDAAAVVFTTPPLDLP